MEPTPETPVNLGPRRVLLDRHPFRPAPLGLTALAIAVTCALSLLVSPGLAVLVYGTPLVFAWWSATRRRDAAVRVEDGALCFEEASRTWRIPLARLQAGYIARGLAETYATLELRGGDTVRITAADEADARAVLTSVGRDVAQLRTVYRRRRIFHQLLAWMLSPVAGGLAATMVAPVAASLGLPAVVSGTLVFLCVTAIFGVVVPPRLNVTLGRDGMAIGGRLGTRFIPWSEVTRVAPGDGSVVVRLQGGRAVSVWCNPDDRWVQEAVVDNANSALATHRAAQQRALDIALLDRNGRSVEAWRSALRALAETAGDYRSASVDRDRLEAVLADPSATSERRIAAALALASHEEGRARVRIAADVSAAPAEREALGRIAAGDDDLAAVEAALAERR